jgi:hypothetical protein
VDTGFSEKIMLQHQPERDGDSRKSHPALAAAGHGRQGSSLCQVSAARKPRLHMLPTLAGAGSAARIVVVVRHHSGLMPAARTTSPHCRRSVSISALVTAG